MLRCAFFFFLSQRKNSRLLLWAGDTHHPQYLKCPKTGFFCFFYQYFVYCHIVCLPPFTQKAITCSKYVL